MVLQYLIFMTRERNGNFLRMLVAHVMPLKAGRAVEGSSNSFWPFLQVGSGSGEQFCDLLFYL